jgi:hypothetical protein
LYTDTYIRSKQFKTEKAAHAHLAKPGICWKDAVPTNPFENIKLQSSRMMNRNCRFYSNLSEWDLLIQNFLEYLVGFNIT